MPTLIEERDSLVAEARQMSERAKQQERNLTRAEITNISGKLDRAKELDERIRAGRESDKVFDALMKRDGPHSPKDGEVHYLDFSPAAVKSMATKAARDMVGLIENGRQKGVLPDGVSYLPPVLSPSDPVVEGQAAAAVTLLSLIPTVQIAGDTGKYFRQSSRSPNAFKAVAPGELKPVQPLGLTEVDVKLAIYAGLSEPQDRFALDDASALTSFISGELLWALQTAVEADIVAGNPAPGDPGITGIMSTSGVRLQPFVNDILATTRQALVGNQTLGYGTNLAWVLSPQDWADAQLLQATGAGTYLMPGAPNQAPPQALWGFPVAISTNLPVGKGLLLERSRLVLYSDTAIKIDVFSPGDLWQRNQVQFRCESRYDLGVLMPTAQVIIDTVATVP